jgi:hypothetical protein
MAAGHHCGMSRMCRTQSLLIYHLAIVFYIALHTYIGKLNVQHCSLRSLNLQFAMLTDSCLNSKWIERGVLLRNMDYADAMYEVQTDAIAVAREFATLTRVMARE